MSPVAPADVNVVGGYGPPRPGYERQGYNMRANDHPGFRWSDPSGGQQAYRPPHQQQQQQQGQQYQSRPAWPSTSEMLRELTQHFTTHVKTTESSIKNLEKQVGQLASDVSRIAQGSSNSLPSQTVVNPQVRSLNALQAWAGIERSEERRVGKECRL